MSDSIAVVITALRDLAPGIREISFGRADGEPFPVFSGGSHVVVSIPLDGRVQRNPYSLLGDPEDRATWRIAVRRQEPSRGGSAWLHEQAAVGMKLELAQPMNLFAVVRTAKHHLLVAGGIGITPILSQARQLARMGASFEVHYAWRGPEFAVYAAELEALAPGRVFGHDQSAGDIIDFAKLFAARPLGTHFYICGPGPMVEASMAAGLAAGWPEASLHSEQFLAPAGGQPFDVVLARTGGRITVGADTSLLEALEAANAPVISLCRGGACGQCETAVVSCDSELDHRDLWLNAADHASARKIMPCVSRAKGGCLTLDL